jgi:hypothetical protein
VRTLTPGGKATTASWGVLPAAAVGGKCCGWSDRWLHYFGTVTDAGWLVLHPTPTLTGRCHSNGVRVQAENRLSAFFFDGASSRPRLEMCHSFASELEVAVGKDVANNLLRRTGWPGESERRLDANRS